MRIGKDIILYLFICTISFEITEVIQTNRCLLWKKLGNSSISLGEKQQNMLTNFTSDAFSIWLMKNQWMIPFVQIDSPRGSENLNIRREKLQNTINKINHFYQFDFPDSLPIKPCFPKISRYMLSSAAFLAHKHFYLQNKIYKNRCKNYEDAKKRLEEILEILRAVYDDDNPTIITIDIISLLRVLQEDTAKIIRLTSKDSVIVRQISSEDIVLGDENSQVSVILQLLFSIKNQGMFDRKSMYVPDNALQEKIDQLFFHPNFAYRQEIDDLLDEKNFTTPEMFTNCCIELMQQMMVKYRLTDQADVAIFSLVFFRTVFNYGHIHFPQFFNPNVENRFHKYINRITLDIAGVSKNILPPHEPNEPIKSIVAKNQRLLAASREITALAFHTTPLDSLACVHYALTNLRFYATESNMGDEAQSFDAIFGLFQIVLVSSDLPNQESVFNYISRFSPIDGLSGLFEYAKATVSATQTQCEKMMNELDAM